MATDGHAKQVIDCNRHAIYCQIIKNKTNKAGRILINKKYAMKLSNVIYRAAKKHKVPARIYTAILMQESGYKLNTVSKANGLRKLTSEERGSYLADCAVKELRSYLNEFDVQACVAALPKYIETTINADFGISQIYYKTAKAFKFDLERLTKDLEYSIEAGAIVLADFGKRYKKREFFWWTRYNARSKSKRNIYKNFVERYL